MNTNIINEAARHALAGTISFPDFVRELLSAGVEYYHVDYIGRRKTFYSAEGDMVVTSIDYEGLPSVASDFSVEDVRADVLDSQQKNQPYRDFTRRAMAAGVQGYLACLRGQRVIYLGRQGDQHIEWFPGAQPAPVTAENIKEIYARPRSGADFPRLIRELKNAGIRSYHHMMATGANVFHGRRGEVLTLEKMGPACPVAERVDLEALQKIISGHQRGLTDYAALCGLVGKAGIEKWVCDLAAMTCSYFDRAGQKVHVERIPDGQYQS
jgi:uncharacterized protein YbcV (DUF1398 family)